MSIGFLGCVLFLNVPKIVSSFARLTFLDFKISREAVGYLLRAFCVCSSCPDLWIFMLTITFFAPWPAKPRLMGYAITVPGVGLG